MRGVTHRSSMIQDASKVLPKQMLREKTTLEERKWQWT